LLYASYAYFAEWNHREPIVLLRRYLSIPGLDEYWKLVARINLASALIPEREYGTASGLLDELLEVTGAREYRLHRAKTLELLATNCIHLGRWADAQRFLYESRAMLRTASPVPRLYLRKWRALLMLKKHGARPDTLAALSAVRAAAQSLGQWETVRDCDRHLAEARGDEQLLRHVYFGTPFPSFRQSLLDAFARVVALPADYLWRVDADRSEETKEGGPVVDIAELAESQEGEVYRLGRFLSSDFYAGFRIPGLATFIDGKSFHPSRSGKTVESSLVKLRAWTVEQRLPLVVSDRGGVLRWSASSPVTIRVPLTSPLEQSEPHPKRKAG
jgi:hypothetical protein